MYCNGCGKEIEIKNDIVREGILSVCKDWGYFSKKDGQRHRFCLCEDCYDKMIERFVLPVEAEEMTELI